MAVELTPLGKLVVGTLKWVAVPIIAALIGLKLIGPALSPASNDPGQPKKRMIAAPPTSEQGKKFQKIRENSAANN